MKSLEAFGIVKKRELIGRKAGMVWFLSPTFSKICSTVVSFLEDKVKNKKQRPTSVEEEIYWNITRESLIDHWMV